MSKNESGFSLVELLVAMVVLGIVSTGVFTLFQAIQRSMIASQYRELATRAAQREVETLRNNNYAQLTPGTPIDFTANIPTLLPSRNGTVDVTEPIAGLRRVDVTVAYKHGSTNNSVKLSSLIGNIGITQ